jgi:hypothetical protein
MWIVLRPLPGEVQLSTLRAWGAVDNPLRNSPFDFRRVGNGIYG